MSDLYGNIPIQGNDIESGKPDPEKTSPRKKKNQDQHPPKRSYTRAKSLVIPLCILFILGGYYGLSATLIPWFIQKKLPSIFLSNTGLYFKVDSASFNPLDFSLTLSDIAVTSPDDDGAADNILDIRHLFAKLDFPSLLRNGLVTKNLRIQEAAVHIERYEQHSYNISQLFQKYTIPTSGGMEFGELPFLYSLNNITVTDSQITFNDTVSGELHIIDRINIHLPTLANFSFDAGKYIEPSFSATINGSPISLINEQKEASSQAEDSNQTVLSCALQDFDISLYVNYIPFTIPVKVHKGKADGKVLISFLSEKDKGLHLRIKFSMHIKDGAFSSHDGTLQLSAPLLNIDGSYDPMKKDTVISNLLLRDPVVIVTEQMTSSTLESLSLAHKTIREKSLTIKEKPHSVSVGLLIGDNGRVIFASKAEQKVYHPVQLSVRNYKKYKNSDTSNKKKSTFRIHGESKDDFSIFTWQGSFENAAPSGQLEVNNLQFDKLLSIISGTVDNSASGTADIKGHLALGRSDKAPFYYSFTQGTILLNSVALKEDKRKWLQSKSVRLSPVTLKNDGGDLGNIFFTDTNLEISTTKLPAALTSLLSNKNYTLQGVDYSGELRISTTDKLQPLHLQKTHLQLLSQGDQTDQRSNFTFTAEEINGGSISAKGKIRLTPPQGSVELSFDNMPAQPVLSAYLQSDIDSSPESRIAGKGNFFLNTRKYAGDVSLYRGEFIRNADDVKTSFKKANFSSLTIDPSTDQFNSKKILFDEYSYISNKLRFTSPELSINGYSQHKERIEIGSIHSPDSSITVSDILPKPVAALFTADKELLLEHGDLKGSITIAKKTKNTEDLRASISLQLNNIAKKNNQTDNLTFSADFQQGGELHGTGSLSVNPLSSYIALHFRDFPSRYIQRFNDDFSFLDISSTLDGNLTMRYPEQLYSGNVDLHHGLLRTPDKTDFMNWQKASLKDFSLSLKQKQLNISTLVLDSPTLFIKSESKPVAAAIYSRLIFSDSDEPKEPKSVSFSQANIPKIIISQGTLDFEDKRLTPPFQDRFTQIKGFINDFHISNSNDPISYDIQGLLQNSPITVTGEIFPGNSPQSKTSRFTLKNFPLYTLKDQISPYFDFALDNISTDISIVRSEGSDKPHLFLELSPIHSIASSSDDTTLMMALITNNSYAISQDIPLRETDSSLFSQCTNHFQKLRIKGAVSSFLLFDSDQTPLADNTSLDFLPGQTTLDETAISTLKNYSELLTERPYLKLTFTSLVNPSSDRNVLKKNLEEIEQERVTKENSRRLEKWQEEHRSDHITAPAPPHEGEITVQDIPTDRLNAFTPLSPRPQNVPEEMLVALGRKRLEKIFAFLINNYNVEPAQIEHTKNVQLVDNLDTPRVSIELGAVQN